MRATLRSRALSIHDGSRTTTIPALVTASAPAEFSQAVPPQSATLSNTESKTLVFRGLQNMPQDMLRGVTYDMRGSASQNPTRALGARPGEVRTFAVKALVTDEVLHPFGKVQPLLIGLILPGPTTSGRSHCADCRLPRTRTCGAPRPPRSFLVTPPPSDPHVRGAPHHQQIVHTCTIMDT